MSSDAVITLKNVSKCYQIYDKPRDRLLQMLMRGRRTYYREFWALHEISLEVGRGEVLGIVGRNGAGKSTLLQLICGTLGTSSGSMSVNGRVAALLELGAGFNPEFSGRENVYLSATVMGLSHKEIDARYDEIVQFAGIGGFIDQPVKTYSSGMYVRLAFAVATSVDPGILVIDEALSVGDGAFARKSFDRIMQLKEKGATILFCSHSMYHIEAICNRALWLEEGRVMMFGAPAGVVSAYNTALMVNQEKPRYEEDELSRPAAPVLAGPARFTRITASSGGVSGRQLSLRSGESDLLIRIEFISDQALATPTIAFGLNNMAGAIVSSAGTLYDDSKVRRNPDGSGTVELLLPKLPLMRGTYRLNLYLACERLIHVYDEAANCVELEVSHAGIEQGVVFLPHQWRNVE